MTTMQARLVGRAMMFTAMFAILVAMPAAVMTLVASLPAQAAHHETTIVDPDGHDDFPGQSDLTAVIAGDGVLEFVWDEPDAANGSFDACALYQTAVGETYQVCVSVETGTNNVTFTQQHCGNNVDVSNAKCTSQVTVTTDLTLACDSPAMTVAPMIDGDDDDDMLVSCTVSLPGGELDLLNTCSKNSASAESDGKDCIGVAAITTAKTVVGGTAGPGDFTLSVTVDGVVTEVPGSTDPTSVPIGITPGVETTITFDEATVAGYEFTSLVCVDGAGTEIVNTTSLPFDLILDTPTVLDCVYTNTEAPAGNLLVTKLSPNGTGTFSFTGDGLDPFDITTTYDDTTNTWSGTHLIENLDPGLYTLAEGDTAGFTLVDNGCVDVEVIAGETAECTVINEAIESATSDKILIGYNDNDGSGDISAGDELHYLLTGTNTSIAAYLETMTVTDSLTGDSVTCPDLAVLPGLAPGDVCELLVSVEVTEADLGTTIANTATVVVPGLPIDPTTVEVEVPAPALEVVKELDSYVDVGGDGEPSPGDEYNFVITATNTGTANLTEVTVSDALTGDSITCPGITAPGETCVLETTYILTADDVAAAELVNVGAAVSDQTDEVTDEWSTQLDQPSLAVVKTSSVETPAGVGSVITYFFDLENDGNVLLTDIDLAESMPVEDLEVVCDWAGDSSDPVTGDAELAPGETITCTGEYTITQADVDAGGVENVVTASGLDPGGEPVDGTDDVTDTLDQNPAMETTKTVDVTSARVGDLVTYTVTVTNTGDVTLSEVTVVDPMIPDLECAWPGDDGVLAPGESADCTGTVEVTRDMIDDDVIVNVAAVNAVDPTGDPLPEQEPDVTIRIPTVVIVIQDPAPTPVPGPTEEPDEVLEAVVTRQDLAQTGQSSRALGAAALATIASGCMYLGGVRRRDRDSES